MTPELRARQQIDLLLQQSGWIVQDRSQTNLAAGPGVAIREALLKTGEADYLLFASGKAIATVEAKPEGYPLTVLKGSPSSTPQVFWITPDGPIHSHFATKVRDRKLVRRNPLVAGHADSCK